ncbi:hypothetical protein [Sinosporangium siamense]|uniref:Secreted protein n=1 Tax=Sinosporangium siamense TaxID=1367973 RepID=A0A919RJE4_9ACTN|nr:hypothetical protein [Sinosporangium siamense]GII92994.1 hypothetical protein Ssi02_32250 [Sinosporangium siamense]
MKIRRLHSALLAVALGASVLAGAAPAVASTQISAAGASGGWPAPDWYLQGPYPTLAACDLAYEDAAATGYYNGLVPCYWFRGGGPWMPGFYFQVYIP